MSFKEDVSIYLLASFTNTIKKKFVNNALKMSFNIDANIYLLRSSTDVIKKKLVNKCFKCAVITMVKALKALAR